MMNVSNHSLKIVDKTSSNNDIILDNHMLDDDLAIAFWMLDYQIFSKEREKKVGFELEKMMKKIRN